MACVQVCLLPSPAQPPHTSMPSPCSPLSPFWHMHQETCRVSAPPPPLAEGEFYLAGREKSGQSKHWDSYHRNVTEELKNPITPTVSTAMVGCISCCLYRVYYWTGKATETSNLTQSTQVMLRLQWVFYNARRLLQETCYIMRWNAKVLAVL